MADRPARQSYGFWIDWVVHPIEAAALALVWGMAKLIGPDLASGLGAFLGRLIGPRTGAHRRALRHIAFAMPETTQDEREQIARAMWDNLGRTLFEYPHLQKISAPPRTIIEGFENVLAARGEGDRSRPLVIVSGHFANWEIPAAAARWKGLHAETLYRPPNNRFVDALVQRMRRNANVTPVGKGSAAAKHSVRVMVEGGALGMLVDQSLSRGVSVPFFGRPAMTAPATAQLAARYDAAILLVRLRRKGGARFVVEVEPELRLVEHGETGDPVIDTMAAINRRFETWIRDDPGSWLWLHRRWPELKRPKWKKRGREWKKPTDAA